MGSHLLRIRGQDLEDPTPWLAHVCARWLPDSPLHTELPAHLGDGREGAAQLALRQVRSPTSPGER